MLRWGLFFLIFFLSMGSQAQSLGDQGRTVRSLGMGSVLVPFVKGADALFYNPAALSRSGLIDIRLMDLTIGTNADTVGQLETIQNIDANDSSTFNSLFGEQIWVKANGRAGAAIPLFAMGYMTDYEVSAQLNNPVFPQFETYFRNDEAYYLGTSFKVAPGTSLGFSLKRINRWGGSTEDLGVADVANASSLSDIGASFSNKGQGTGLDFAILHEVPAPFSPTFTLVWQDVGSTAFRMTAGSEAPPAIEQNLTFGTGVGVDLPGLDLLLGMEVRHLLQSDLEIGKKLYIGTEISLPLIDVRAGYTQGYLSYGVGLNLFILNLDLAAYQEELGAYPGQSGDQRYMVSLNFDLSFDAEFNFTDNSGKKRKLKQRR